MLPARNVLLETGGQLKVYENGPPVRDWPQRNEVLIGRKRVRKA